MQHKHGFVRFVSQFYSLGLSGNIWPGGHINILLHFGVCINSLTEQWNWTFLYHLPYCASFTPLSLSSYINVCHPLPAFFHSHPPSSLSYLPSGFFAFLRLFPLSNSFLPFAALKKRCRWHDVIFKFQEMCSFIRSLFIFFGCFGNNSEEQS